MQVLPHNSQLSPMSVHTSPNMSSQPSSQSPPNSVSTPTTSSGSRRPPRKSTLTQQQKNQKRQRATQDQLVTLEAEFIKNPTPTAVVRERIAEEINMTERSVQIWFQNRRAKIKLLAKKSIETGEDCGEIPDSMRHYLAMQAAEQGKPIGIYNRGGYGYNFLAADPNPNGKVLIHHFTCRSLSVGTWRRIAQKNMDLIIFYSPQKACMTYYINNDAAGYKIEYPFAAIDSIDLETLDTPDPQNGGQHDARLVIKLSQPPNFFMDSSNSGGFYEVGDFTENSQASQVFTHYLGGPAKLLASQLAKLTTLDVFVNRHNMMLPPNMHLAQPINIFDHPSLSVSAPVSPHIIRPASCSNDIISQPTFRLQPPESYHRHKRTRSRSVPVAIDFSQQQLPPSFAFNTASDHLYAPAPQHAIGNALRIDTSNTGFFDFRSYPLSATTASPSDYASPPLMTSSLQTGDMAANGFGTPFTAPWVSPSLDAASLGPSVSPLSMGHSDPIMNESPQMTAIRSSSADLFPMPDEFANESHLLSELYSKQSLEMTGPLDESDDMDLQMMQIPFSHLSPEPSAV